MSEATFGDLTLHDVLALLRFVRTDGPARDVHALDLGAVDATRLLLNRRMKVSGDLGWTARASLQAT